MQRVFSTVALAGVVAANGVFEARKSEIIADPATSSNCKVTQGVDITMINCPTSYELYNTAHISEDWHSQPWHGSITQTAVAPTINLANGAINWVENDNDVMQANLDENGKIQVVKLMSLGGPGYFGATTVRAVFVTDQFVVVRLKSLKNQVFEIPVIIGSVSMPVGVQANGYTLDPAIMAYDVSVDKENPGAYYMYTINRLGGQAALNNRAPNIETEIQKYTFSFNEETKVFSIDNKETWPQPDFNGESYDIEIASSYFIVSCSDCSQPQVSFFDRSDMALAQTYELAEMLLDKYFISVSQDFDWQGQLMIAGRDHVDMVDWAHDEVSGIPKFRLDEKVFELDYTPADGFRNNLWISHSGNFLTIKSESEQGLNIITLCSNYEKYNTETHTCDPCNHSYRSFGFQQESCYSCSSLRSYGRQNGIEQAYYDGMCTSSEIQTGWVLILTILTVAVAGFVFIALPVVQNIKEHRHNPLHVVPAKKEAAAEMEFAETTDRQKSDKFKPTKGGADEIVSSHSSFNSHESQKKMLRPVDTDEEANADESVDKANFAPKTTLKAAI